MLRVGRMCCCSRGGPSDWAMMLATDYLLANTTPSKLNERIILNSNRKGPHEPSHIEVTTETGP